VSRILDDKAATNSFWAFLLLSSFWSPLAPLPRYLNHSSDYALYWHSSVASSCCYFVILEVRRASHICLFCRPLFHNSHTLSSFPFLGMRMKIIEAHKAALRARQEAGSGRARPKPQKDRKESPIFEPEHVPPPIPVTSQPTIQTKDTMPLATRLSPFPSEERQPTSENAHKRKRKNIDFFQHDVHPTDNL
jgi:hypothetical protein